MTHQDTKRVDDITVSTLLPAPVALLERSLVEPSKVLAGVKVRLVPVIGTREKVALAKAEIEVGGNAQGFPDLTETTILRASVTLHKGTGVEPTKAMAIAIVGSLKIAVTEVRVESNVNVDTGRVANDAFFGTRPASIPLVEWTGVEPAKAIVVVFPVALDVEV